MKKEKISKTLYDWSADMDMIINTGECNGNTTISISQQDNKCTLKMSTCSMVYGSDLIKLLKEILDCYKDSIHEDRYYSYGEIINILCRKLFENEMCENENLYKALDDWVWSYDDDDKTDCEQGED